MTIPYFDLPNRYSAWADDVVDVVREVADSDEFILKSRVAELEGAIADRVGAAHAVAVASGTGALTLLLKALGIGAGDEVVTPAFSFVSSASTVALSGARPAFADVDYETATLQPEAAEAAITRDTRGLLPAYLFSCAPPMGRLRELAERHGLAVLEDSAVALGATVDGLPAGRHGTAGVYSFFPAKPLGGIGDGGMIVTDDAELADACRMLRNHGQQPGVRFYYREVGLNCRMDETVAAFLLRRLPLLDGYLEERRRLAEAYDAGLRDLAPEVLPPPADFASRSVYTYVVRARDREGLREHLTRKGIGTAVYYERPLHLEPAFAYLGHQPGDFPVAEQLSRECLALPLHPEMDAGAVETVCREIAAFYGA